MDLSMDSVDFTTFRPSMRRVSWDAHRYEAVISHNGRQSWKFKFHDEIESIKEKSKIKPYDLCVF